MKTYTAKELISILEDHIKKYGENVETNIQDEDIHRIKQYKSLGFYQIACTPKIMFGVK
jgi:hypothetical protein